MIPKVHFDRSRTQFDRQRRRNLYQRRLRHALRKVFGYGFQRAHVCKLCMNNVSRTPSHRLKTILNKQKPPPCGGGCRYPSAAYDDRSLPSRMGCFSFLGRPRRPVLTLNRIASHKACWFRNRTRPSW
jgi:hypothetical protein